MDQGNVVEMGDHKSLLKIKNGVYAKLHQVQFLEQEQLTKQAL